MRDEKKYEVLPGVEIPDIKKIQKAASDFSVSEVGDVDIKNTVYEPVYEVAAPAGVSAEELARLQQLGVKVAEDEERSKAASRAKMDKIMHQAVQAPESISDLKASHIAQLNEEKRKELEAVHNEALKQQAEDEAKTKAREERRQLQQRLLEEAKQKAAKEREEKERAKQEQAEKEAEAKQAEAAAFEDKPEENSPVVKKTAKVVSDNEAFEDFKEFLDDSDNE